MSWRFVPSYTPFVSEVALRYASEFDSSGYAVAARRCIGALVEHGVDLVWEPLVERAGFGRSRTAVAVGAPIDLRARRRNTSPSELTVLHCVPQSWHRLRHELSSGHVIGHVVWECEQMPSRWCDELSAADELWVPTTWNRDAFAEIFTGPIHVVPHVVDTRPGTTPPIDVSSDRPIVAIVSAWDWRKRPDRTIDAALTAFAGDSDVVIVVKTTDVPIGWPGPFRSPQDQIAEIVTRHQDAPTVVVDTGVWTDEQMLGLLERADCFLSLTASEGWGLGAFDAATRGTPVVVTGFGGQVEWLGNDHLGLIPFTLVDADHPDTSLFEPGMKWAQANIDDAIDLVRGVIRGSNTSLLERSTALATELRDKYSSARVGSELVQTLKPAFRSATPSAAVARISSNCAERVLVLTPIIHRHVDQGYVDVVRGLRSDGTELEVVIGVTDDAPTEGSEAVYVALRAEGISVRIVRVEYADEARFRNRLLFAGLGNHDWVVWLDSSVRSVPNGLLKQMRSSHADVIQPCMIDQSGEAVRSSAWTDRGDAPLVAYRGHDAVNLHSIDPRLVLVRADCHRDGLVWPTFAYGTDDLRARFDPVTLGRNESGEIETEGMGLMAGTMGYTVVGMPDIEIIHESSAPEISVD